MLEPQQARSRRSLERLLDAARDTLARDGLKGATIPRIAARAKLSPAAVYRRFTDKDALLQEAILGFLVATNDAAAPALEPARFAATPLPAMAEQIIGSLIFSYRSNEKLLREILRYAMRQPGSAFWRRMDAIEKTTVDRLVHLMLLHRDRIRHPDPESAVRFGLMSVVFTMRDLMLLDPAGAKYLFGVEPDDRTLRKELTRMFLRYLDPKGV